MFEQQPRRISIASMERANPGDANAYGETFPIRCSGMARASSLLAIGLLVSTIQARALADVLPNRGPDETEDTCARIMARANADVALLESPHVGIQAIRFPPSNSPDLSGWDAGSRQIQVRSFLEYSLTNLIAGTRTIDLAEAECRQTRAAQPVKAAIRIAADQGRRSALAKQLAFLSERESEIARLEQEAERRVAAQLGTLAELSEIRLLALNLRQLRSETEETLERVEAVPGPEPSGPIGPLVESYRQATMDMESAHTRVRQVTPWNISLRGGIATTPASSSVDWFGAVEVVYNLGGLFRPRAEATYLAARSRELASGADEIIPVAYAIDGALTASVSRLRRERQLLELREGQLQGDAVALVKAETLRQSHAAIVLRLQHLAVEARLIYLRELARQRETWERHHGQ